MARNHGTDVVYQSAAGSVLYDFGFSLCAVQVPAGVGRYIVGAGNAVPPEYFPDLALSSRSLAFSGKQRFSRLSFEKNFSMESDKRSPCDFFCAASIAV